MTEVYVKMGTSSYCPQCNKLIKTGMRILYDGVNEYDSFMCMTKFQARHTKTPREGVPTVIYSSNGERRF